MRKYNAETNEEMLHEKTQKDCVLDCPESHLKAKEKRD